MGKGSGEEGEVTVCISQLVSKSAPLCPGPALLQSLAGCELQAGEGLAATFCFLVYVCLFSCRHPLPLLYLLQGLKSIGIIFVPLEKSCWKFPAHSVLSLCSTCPAAFPSLSNNI